jgi:DNA polymerase III delta prime subunit
MNQYADFNYVSYILDCEINQGYSLFLKAKDRERREKYWDLFLVDRSLGNKENFEDYFKENSRQAKQNVMTYDEKDKEEKRIIEKVSKIDWSNMKDKEILI